MSMEKARNFDNYILLFSSRFSKYNCDRLFQGDVLVLLQRWLTTQSAMLAIFLHALIFHDE